jgi:hypothetical protein
MAIGRGQHSWLPSAARQPPISLHAKQSNSALLCSFVQALSSSYKASGSELNLQHLARPDHLLLHRPLCWLLLVTPKRTTLNHPDLLPFVQALSSSYKASGSELNQQHLASEVQSRLLAAQAFLSFSARHI